MIARGRRPLRAKVGAEGEGVELQGEKDAAAECSPTRPTCLRVGRGRGWAVPQQFF